jgi:hypothetical protein
VSLYCSLDGRLTVSKCPSCGGPIAPVRSQREIDAERLAAKVRAEQFNERYRAHNDRLEAALRSTP